MDRKLSQLKNLLESLAQDIRPVSKNICEMEKVHRYMETKINQLEQANVQ